LVKDNSRYIKLYRKVGDFVRAKHLVEKQKELTETQHNLQDRHNRVQYLEHFEDDYYKEKEKYNNLISFLSDYLFNVTDITYKEEKTIREQIKCLLVANNEPMHNVSIKNGYVSKVDVVDTLIRPVDIPDDIGHGYWKLVNGKYELDKEKFAVVWSVV